MKLDTQSTHPSELWRGFWGIQVLQTGQTLGLFENLLEPKSAASVAQALHLEERYITLWCEAAQSFNLLIEDEGKYQVPKEYESWLLSSSGFTESHLHLSNRVNETLRAVFGGRALPEPPISLRLLLQKNLKSNYRWLFQQAATIWPKLQSTLNGPGKVLEVGCGVGYGLSYLRRFHPQLELFGLEADYECAQEAERGTKAVIHLGQLPGERFAKGFDLIVCFRTLSAAKSPQDLVKECSALLKPGGLFLLGSEVTDDRVERKCEARLKGERLAYNVLAGESLINSFSTEELKQLLSDSGLSLVKELEAPDWATPAFLCEANH